MVKWVVEPWKAISTKVVVRTFAAFGITSSNPNDIHCLRASGAANGAYSEILKLHQRDHPSVGEEESLHVLDLESESDIFSDCDTDMEFTIICCKVLFCNIMKGVALKLKWPYPHTVDLSLIVCIVRWPGRSRARTMHADPRNSRRSAAKQ